METKITRIDNELYENQSNKYVVIEKMNPILLVIIWF